MNEIHPSLDHWTVVFLIAAAQGLFLTVLVFTQRTERRNANLLLGFLLLGFSLTLIDYVGFWTNYNWYFPHLMGIYEPLAFTFGPLTWLYLVSINTGRPWHWKDLGHFIPAFLVLIYKMPVFLLPLASKHHLLQGFIDEVAEERLFPWVGWQLSWVTTLHLLVYGRWCIYSMRKFGASANEDAAQAAIRRRWNRLLIGLFLAFAGSYLSYMVIIMTPIFNVFYDYGIAMTMAVAIYSIGILGYRRPEVFSGQAWQGVFMPEKYRHSGLTTSASQSLLERLMEYMERDRPYLDNELRLASLADQLHVSPHHLSQVINEQCGQHFSDFINAYRIEEVKRLLSMPRNADALIINLAYAAGFNNKTSFNKAFKIATGLSPTEYRQRMFGARKAVGSGRSD